VNANKQADKDKTAERRWELKFIDARLSSRCLFAVIVGDA